jgi:glycosyltransferase involved in cell wall biosynthesis
MAVRVLYVLESLGMGGAERGLVLTLQHFDRDRVRPEVAYLWEPGLLGREIRDLGVPVHRLRAPRGDWSLTAIPRLRRLIASRHIDIVHTALVWSSIGGRIAGKLAGKKVVSHIVNADPEGWRDRVLPPRVARNTRIVARVDAVTGRLLVDRFVAVSEAARDAAISSSRWPARKIRVVRRGQDLEDLAARAAREPDPPLGDPGDPCILTVGRLMPQKGQRYLVDAMPRVLEEFPGARLLIAGEGSLRRMLEDRARAFKDRVAFLGLRRDVPSLLSRADLFVFPSLWEGQGNALIEAMAVGRPIVATRIPAVTEVIHDAETGVLARAGDAGALAEAMLRVLRDPVSADAMAGRAKEAAQQFDIRETTRDLEAVYDELAPR